MTLSSSSLKEIQEAARLHMEALEEHERLRDADHSTEVEDAFFNQLSTHKAAAAAYRVKVPPSVVLAMAEEILRMREAAAALVVKLDAVAPYLKEQVVFAYVHGQIYDGPNYGVELEALRVAALPSTTDEGRT